MGDFRNRVRTHPGLATFSGLGLLLCMSNDAWALGEEASLAGQWTASALSEVWTFAAWPTACGPKPEPQPSPAALSLVNEESGELSFSGLGRAFRTNQCWEQYPGLRRVAHSRSAQAWSSTCKSADSDPRQANVHTSLTAFGDTLIKFRETGSYEFHLGSAKCSANVARTRTFSRTSREVNEGGAQPQGAAAIDVATSTVGSVAAAPSVADVGVGVGAGAGVPAPEVALLRSDGKETPQLGADLPVRNDCEPAGDAREIRIPRPVNWLQPGASYRLTPALVDATGCVVAKGPFSYSVEPETDAVHVGLRSGLIQVSPHAAEGKYTVVIRSGQLREVISVPVITREGLAAFLQAPSEAPLGVEAAGPTVSEIVGASPAAAVDNATPRKWWFIALAGSVTFGLGLLGLRLLRAGSRPTMPPPPPRDAAVTLLSATHDVARQSPSATARAAVTSGQLALTVVPPPVAQPQRRSNPPPKPRQGIEVPSGEGRACPQCGTQYTDGSVFCGVDGAKLGDSAER